MNVASLTTPRWVVSTRTDGEVLTAGVSHHCIELVLLGVPAGFTPAELEGWLGDLGGVAAETSSTDTRIRAIPALLHHSLTGLLFSHAELWERTGSPAPCSAAFVDTPEGAAFGWVGDAKATLRVDGREYQPQWVRVRDEAGREAFATVLAPGVSADVTLEYWPSADRSAAAPCAIEADWSVQTAPAEAPAAVGAPAPVVAEAERPAESAALRANEPEALPPALLPESLPTQQPSLAQTQYDHSSVEGLDEEIGLPVEDLLADSIVTESSQAPLAAESAEPVAPPEPETPKGKHPVGRWLDRMMGWGRKAAPQAASQSTRSDEAAPLSVYDSLLSDSTPVEAQLEQTTLSWSAAESGSPESAPIPEAIAESIPSARAQQYAPLVVEDEAANPVQPAAEIIPAVQITSPAPPPAGTLQAAGLAEILLAAKLKQPVLVPTPTPNPAPTPVADAQAPEAQAFAPRLAPPAPLPAHSSAPIVAPSDVVAPETLPVLSPPAISDGTQPLEIVREPVGADDQRFAIPPFPAERMAAVPSASKLLPLPEIPAALLGVVQVDYLTSESVAESSAAAPALELEPLSIDRNVASSQERALSLGQTAPLAEGATTPSMSETLRRATPSSKWPTLTELESKSWYQQPWAWGLLVVALFAAGWLLGHLQTPGPNAGPGPMQRALRAVGLGGSRFEAVVESDPPGAWIAVDGKDIARRTPANIELPPGEHTLTLTLTELGSIQVPVKGQNKDRLTLKESLHGDLEIFASDPSIPISVSVDRKPMGFAPVKMEAIAPGLHEVQFSGPGMPAWAQTVQVGVRQTAQVMAHPISSPATGIIQVQAQLNDDQGSSPLNGAQVFVDGELRGATPTSLELPRGPHSLKLSWHGETTPVQVIDLPGGNQRFAQFQFGLDLDDPTVHLLSSNRVMSADQVSIISATFVGLQPGDLRESWLHVRASEGIWRRYPMSVMKGPNGAVVTSVFPPSAFDGQGNTRWYVSGQTLQGDEYFSEIQRSSLASERSASKRTSTPAP